jgi:hypothetical protein
LLARDAVRSTAESSETETVQRRRGRRDRRCLRIQTSKRLMAFMFLCGALAALMFADRHTDVVDRLLISEVPWLHNVGGKLGAYVDSFPALFDEINALLPSLGESSDGATAGDAAAAAGLRRKHPVFFIPGFVTSSLTLWQGEDCMKKQLRKKVWGGMTMLSEIITNQRCCKFFAVRMPIFACFSML